MDLAYPARFEADADGRILVTFRDLPEAATDGAAMTEALAEAVDCLTSMLFFRMSHGEILPLPSPPQRGEWPVVPEMAIAMKAALHQAMAKQGLSATDLGADCAPC